MNFQRLKETLGSQNKEVLIFIGIITLLLVIALASVLIFTKNTKEEPTIIAADETFDEDETIENVDIIINTNGFDPGSVDLVADQEYNFRIIKINNAPCEAVRNIEMGYKVELPNTANQFPVRIPDAGDYTFECIGQNARMKVEVN